MRARAIVRSFLLGAGLSVIGPAGFACDEAFLSDPRALRDYRGLYALGRECGRLENWSLSASFLDKAIQLQPGEGGKKVPLIDTENDPYLPHYHLGVAFYELGDYASALKEWEESERQGFVQSFKSRTKKIANYRDTILGRFSSAVEVVKNELQMIRTQLLPAARESTTVQNLLDQAGSLLESAERERSFEQLKAARALGRDALPAAEAWQEESARQAAREARKAYDDAEQLLREGACSKDAMTAFRGLLDRDIAAREGPAPVPRLRLAQAALQCGDLGEARRQFDQVVVTTPGTSDERIRLGETLERAETTKRVLASYGEARDLIATGGCETKAVSVLESLAQVDGDRVALAEQGLSLDLLMARAYLGCQDIDRARRAIARVPRTDAAGATLGEQIAMAQKKFERERYVRQLFDELDRAERALAAGGCQPEAIKQIVGIVQLGWPEEARRQKPGESPFAALAEAHTSCGNLKQAQSWLDDERRQNFASPDRLAGIANRLQQSIVAWGARRDDAGAVSRYLAGRALMTNSGCNPEAVAMMERAVERMGPDGARIGQFVQNGTTYDPAYDLAVAYQRCGEPERAKKYMAVRAARPGASPKGNEQLEAWLRRTERLKALPSYALVVGMSNYTGGWAPLESVEHDVHNLKRVLEEHNFKVTLVENLSKSDLEKVFQDFFVATSRATKEIGRMVFYYAGHGWSETLQQGSVRFGYLVPVDTPVSRSEPSNAALLIGKYLVQMEDFRKYSRLAANVRHQLFVFDSCFSGTVFDAIGAKIGEDRRDLDVDTALESESRIFMTAGNDGESVPEPSRYAQAFIAGLEGVADLDADGLVLGNEMAKYLDEQGRTYFSERRKNTPQWGYLTDRETRRGVIGFQPLPPSLRDTHGLDEPTAEQIALRGELKAWEALLDTDDVVAIRGYADNHAQSIFAPVARAMASGLQAR